MPRLRGLLHPLTSVRYLQLKMCIRDRYSIVISAKENGLVPMEYLTYLLDNMRRIDLNDTEAIDRLLPWSEQIPEECRRKEEA